MRRLTFRHQAALVAGLCAALVASALLAVGLGAAVVPPTDTAAYLWAALTGGTISADEVTRYQIVWQIRTPRVLLAAVVGAGLGTVGVAVQSLVRNALGDSAPVYTIILVMYFVLAFLLTRGMRALERHAKAGIGQTPEKGKGVLRKLNTRQQAEVGTGGGA